MPVSFPQFHINWFHIFGRQILDTSFSQTFQIYFKEKLALGFHKGRKRRTNVFPCHCQKHKREMNGPTRLVLVSLQILGNRHVGFALLTTFFFSMRTPQVVLNESTWFSEKSNTIQYVCRHSQILGNETNFFLFLVSPSPYPAMM